MSHAPLAPSQIPGVIAVNVFICISTAALLSVVGRVLYLAVTPYLSSENRITPRAFTFFGSQVGYYAACLLVANFINCIAGLLGIPWLLKRGITEGPLCTSQALILQFGNITNGYFTAAIAVHTFNSLVLKRRQSALTCSLFIAFGWFGAAGMTLIPHYAIRPSPYGISWLSCGIRQELPFYGFVFHLLPIFVSSLVSAVLYSLIFLVLRGTLSIRGGLKLQLNPVKRQDQSNGEYQAFVASLASTMLWFPIAYVVMLVPYSVTRLLMATQNPVVNVPFPVIVLSYVLWFLLGAVNVFILYKTFCVLGPAIDGKINFSQKDVESMPAKNPSFSSTNWSNVEKAPSPLRQSTFRPSLRPLTLNTTHERTGSHDSVRGLLTGSSASSTFRSPVLPGSLSAARMSPSHARKISGEQHSRALSLSGQPSFDAFHHRFESHQSLSRQSSWEAPALSAAPRAVTQLRSPASKASLSIVQHGQVIPRARNGSLGQTVDKEDIASWLEQNVRDSHALSASVRLSAVMEATRFPPSAPSATAGPRPAPDADLFPTMRSPQFRREW